MVKSKKFLAGFAIAAWFMASAAVAGPLALTGLDLGLWQLHEIGIEGSAGRAVCVRDPMQLVQLYHAGVQCTRFTLEDTATHLTIQYTCPGKGYGRTTLSVEEPGLIKLDTQGIGPDRQPFDVTYEGRRTGACVPAGPLR